MLKKGTIVNIYEDPFTRIRLEGQARIMKHEADLVRGAALYTVVFLDDRDHTPRLRKLVESVSTEQCCCYEQQGDNPDCQVHTRQLDDDVPPTEPSETAFDVRCPHCNRLMDADELYCYCEENTRRTDGSSQIVHVRSRLASVFSTHARSG